MRAWRGGVLLSVGALVSVSFLVLVPGPARGTIVFGVQNGVWDAAGSPYFVEGDVFVTTGLDIMPGTSVIFNGQFVIDAQAPLRADLTDFLGNLSVACAPILCGAIRLGPGSAGSHILDSTLGQMATGIIVEGGLPQIERNLVFNTNVGMVVNTSNVLVRDVNMSGNQVAYSINAGASPTIENGTVNASAMSDFTVGGDSHPVILNTTFDGMVAIVDGLSNLTVRNYLDVVVLDSGSSPIPGADVFVRENLMEVYDSTAGDPKTGADGRVRWIQTTDRVYTFAGEVPVANEAEVASGTLVFPGNPRTLDMAFSHILGQEEVFQAGGDTTPPQVTATMPGHAAADVPVATTIAVSFSESMSTATTEAAFAYTDGTTTFDAADGGFSWPTQDEFIFDPTVDLAFCTAYTADVGAGATDLAGNPLAPGPAPNPWTFTTENGTPVQVTFFDPVGAAVSITARITLSFSRPVDTGSVEAAFAYTDGTGWWNQDNGTFEWDADATQVSFAPTENLAVLTAYTVWLNATAEDLCGNTLDGNANGGSEGSPTDDLSWGFATEAADAAPPTVLQVSPANGTTGVAVNSPIVVTFSENMNETATEAALTLTDGSTTLNATDGSVIWRKGSREMTLFLASPLRARTDFTASLNGSLARDPAGNGLDGNGNGTPEGSPDDDYQWDFTTGQPPDQTPPTVVYTDPGIDEEDVDVGIVVTVVFSEPMDRPTAQAAFRLRGPNGTVSGQLSWDSDKDMRFTPDESLVYLTAYDAEVGVGALDLSGNSMEAEFAWSFTTEPWRGNISGTVEGPDGRPLEGVTVTVVELNVTTTTAANGTYLFKGIPAGTYNVTFAHEGYDTERRTVTLEEGQWDVVKDVRMLKSGGPADWLWVFLLAVIIFILAMLYFSQRKRGEEGEMHLEEMEREVAVVERPTMEEHRPPEEGGHS